MTLVDEAANARFDREKRARGGLAFEIARANAELLSSEAGTAPANDASSPQSLAQQQTLLETQRQSIQQEITAERQSLAGSGKNKPLVQAKPGMSMTGSGASKSNSWPVLSMAG